MASSTLDFDDRLSGYVRRPGSPEPEDGKARPLTARIVGGRPSYGNVAKLPAALWKNFAIAVVDHVPPDHHPMDAERVDIAIALVDISSTRAKEEAKNHADQVLYTTASWASISIALQRTGFLPYPGSHMMRPPPRAEPANRGPTTAPQSAPVTEPLPVEEPVAVRAPAPAPAPVPAAPVRPSPVALAAAPRPEPDLSIPDPLVAEIDALREMLDTPAVRAVTGRAVTLQAVFDIVVRRGIAAVAADLER